MGNPADTPRPAAGKYIYLDVLRCTAAYLVIAAHCLEDVVRSGTLLGTRTWWVFNICGIVARMSISIFFMISGYLLLSDPRTLDIGLFYRRRLCKLLPPFLVWDVIYFLEQCVVNGREPDVRTFFRELADQSSGYHLWFVYQIIGLYLLMPFLKKIVDHCTTKEILIFLAVVMLRPTIFRLVNVVQSALTVKLFSALVEGFVGFLLTGYLLGSIELSPKQRYYVYAMGLGGLILGVWGNYHFTNPHVMELVFNEGYCIVHYMTSAAFFVLVKQIADRLPGWLLRVTEKLSGMTYGIYLSHVLVLDWFMIKATLYWANALTPAQHALSRFLFVAPVTTLLVWVISRIPGVRKLLM